MIRNFLLLPLVACAALLTGCVAEGPGPVLAGGAVYPGYGPGYAGGPAPYYGSGYGYGPGYGPAPIYGGGGVAVVQTDVYNERDYYYRNGHRYRRAGRGYGNGNNRGNTYVNRSSNNRSRETNIYNNRQRNVYVQQRGGRPAGQARGQSAARRGKGQQHTNRRSNGTRPANQ